METSTLTPHKITAGQLFSKLRCAPVIIQAYMIFAIGAAVLGISLRVGGGLHFPLFIATCPYLAWEPHQEAMYLLTVYGIVIATMTAWRKTGFVILLLLLAVVIALGIVDLFQYSDRRIWVQGRIAYAPQRPIVTIVVPLAWLLLLLAPLVRMWIKNPHERSSSVTPQFTLVDLLYAIFVAAVCLALSIALIQEVKNRQQLVMQARSNQQGASS